MTAQPPQSHPQSSVRRLFEREPTSFLEERADAADFINALRRTRLVDLTVHALRHLREHGAEITEENIEGVVRAAEIKVFEEFVKMNRAWLKLGLGLTFVDDARYSSVDEGKHAHSADEVPHVSTAT